MYGIISKANEVYIVIDAKCKCHSEINMFINERIYYYNAIEQKLGTRKECKNAEPGAPAL